MNHQVVGTDLSDDGMHPVGSWQVLEVKPELVSTRVQKFHERVSSIVEPREAEPILRSLLPEFSKREREVLSALLASDIHAMKGDPTCYRSVQLFRVLYDYCVEIGEPLSERYLKNFGHALNRVLPGASGDRQGLFSALKLVEHIGQDLYRHCKRSIQAIGSPEMRKDYQDLAAEIYRKLEGGQTGDTGSLDTTF